MQVETPRSDLISGIKQIGLDLSVEQIDQLMAYLTLLQKWNKVYNLTAIRDPHEMLVKHLLDSLAVAPFVTSESLIDVGSGGGLPGVPLAIVYPDRQIDMLDSNIKKTRFITQAKAELGLHKSAVIHSRVELYQPETLYDGVISRAFASLDDMLHWTPHLIGQGGTWWAMKAQEQFEDLGHLPDGVSLSARLDIEVPMLDAERMLLKVTKQ